MHRRLLSLLFAFSTAAWVPLHASEHPVPPDARSSIVVSLQEGKDGAMQLEGSFAVGVPSATVWSVLTDYEHMPEFVSAMHSSHVQSQHDGILMVEQESVGRVMFFHRTVRVLLKVREEPLRSIVFEDASKESFERYEGSWRIKQALGSTVVTYRLTAKPDFAAPGFLMRSAYRKMVGELLEQLRAEMNSRSAPQKLPDHEATAPRTSTTDTGSSPHGGTGSR
ncbi:MAG: SRPBCC family protein [Acidobacteriota bacterium]